MDKLVHYREIIKAILLRYVEFLNRTPKLGREIEVVFDEERDHYMLLINGWSESRHLLNRVVYVRIRHEKFYIEEDWLEQGIATDLLEAGVPNEDIVLAFHHPDMRPFTEFAVA